MPLFKALFFFFIVSFSVISAASGQSKYQNNEVLVIQNSSKDVEMGINSSEIFLIINEKVMDMNNEEFQQRYEMEYQQFIDSKGRMIISEPVFLKSKTISIPLEDISSITIMDGDIKFQFYHTPAISFDDIKDENGRALLKNFYPSDLQKIESFFNRLR